MLKRFQPDRRIIIRAFAFTALFFFAAHLYRFTNASYSHDSLLLNQSDDHLPIISMGRFLQPLYWKLRGDIPAPLLVGLLSFAFLSMTVILIASLLEITSALSIALVSSVLTANATLTFLGGSYVGWMDAYLLAFLLAATSVYVCRRWRFGFLAAPAPLLASLGLYQSYISAAALLFLMLLVKSALDGKAPGALFREALKDLFVLLAGLLLYAAVLPLALSAADVTLSTGQNSLAGVGEFSGISILSLLADTYLYPLRYMLAPQTHLSRFCALAGLGVFALGGVSYVHLLRSRRVSLPAALLSLLAILLMPFAMNAIYFISKGFVHQAMIHAFFLSFAFPIYLAGQAAQDGVLLRAVRSGIAALVLFIYGCNFVTSNQLYLRRDLEYQSTLSVMTRVIDRIENMDDYEPASTPVVIVGNLSDSRLSMTRPGFEHLSAYGANSYAVTYPETNIRYLWQTLGYPANLADADTHSRMAMREDVRAIPVFPAKDCCQMIDGMLVVRIGIPGISY